MFKALIFACLFLVALAYGERLKLDDDDIKQDDNVKRVARQLSPMPGIPPDAIPMPDGQPGNLGMQGLGNFPDPTEVIKKGQEVANQFLSGFGGRRRRDIQNIAPPPPESDPDAPSRNQGK